MAQLTEKARQRLNDPNFGYLATIMEDGSPQVSPVWVDVEGDQILFNTAKGRVKEQNMRRDPRVAISITDRERSSRMATVRGRVVERLQGDAGWAVIDRIAEKYVGGPYPLREDRVAFLIAPDHAIALAF